MVCDSSDNIFVSGQTTGALGGEAQTGSQDAALMKFNSGGTRLWTKLSGVLTNPTAAPTAAPTSQPVPVVLNSTWAAEQIEVAEDQAEAVTAATAAMVAATVSASVSASVGACAHPILSAPPALLSLSRRRYQRGDCHRRKCGWRWGGGLPAELPLARREVRQVVLLEAARLSDPNAPWRELPCLLSNNLASTLFGCESLTGPVTNSYTWNYDWDVKRHCII